MIATHTHLMVLIYDIKKIFLNANNDYLVKWIFFNFDSILDNYCFLYYLLLHSMI